MPQLTVEGPRATTTDEMITKDSPAKEESIELEHASVGKIGAVEW